MTVRMRTMFERLQLMEDRIAVERLDVTCLRLRETPDSP